MIRRRTLDDMLDRVRFALDTFPSLDYQPLPWLGKHRAKREAGTWERWEAVRDVIAKLGVETSLDVGANVGWFSIQLAKRGVLATAVEQEPKFYRSLLHARHRLGLRSPAVLIVSIGRDTVRMLPSADAVLFLSVWHHLVRHEGLEAATEVLQRLWSRAGRVLFFEAGETEIPSHWRLPPLEPTPDDFFRRYLQQTCAGAELQHLGRYAAFAPDDSLCERTLWALVRPAGDRGGRHA